MDYDLTDIMPPFLLDNLNNTDSFIIHQHVLIRFRDVV